MLKIHYCRPDKLIYYYISRKLIWKKEEKSAKFTEHHWPVAKIRDRFMASVCFNTLSTVFEARCVYARWMYVMRKSITAGFLPSFLLSPSQQTTDQQSYFLFLKILDGMSGRQGNDGQVVCQCVHSRVLNVSACKHMFNSGWGIHLEAAKPALLYVTLQDFVLCDILAFRLC